MKVLYYAFFLFERRNFVYGFGYRGIIGLMKEVDRDSEALDFGLFENCFSFVYAQIQDVKFGFKNF